MSPQNEQQAQVSMTTEAEKPNPAIWGADGNAAKEVSTVDEQGGLVDTVMHYWRSLDSSILPNLNAAVNADKAAHQDIINYEVAHNNPWRASLAAGYYALVESGADMALAMSSPKQLALTIATSGAAEAAGLLKTAKALKASTMLANLYFSWRGSQQMLTSQQPGETGTEAVGRQVAGGAQALLSAIGVKSSAADILHPLIQKRLGLSGDLAAKVQDEVTRAAAVESAAKSESEQVLAVGKGQAESAQQIGEGIQSSIDKEMRVNTNDLVGKVAQAVVAEQARVEQVYGAAIAKATGPVATVAELRTMITNTMEDWGMQNKDIPPRVFKGVPGTSTRARAATGSEKTAAQMAVDLMKSGMTVPDVRSAMANMSYLPAEVDVIMNMTGVPAQTTMDFEETRTLATNLWNAANAATDSNQRNGLFEAHKQIQAVRQRAANDQGFGPSFKNANEVYSRFKRELGVGEMAKFIEAENISEQNTISRMSTLLSPKQGEAILKLFKVAGVNTSGLEALAEEQVNTEEGTKQTIQEIKKQTASRASDITKTAAATALSIGKESPIIPGKSNLDLAGMETAAIRRKALATLANNARKSGITNPYAFIQITIGLIRLAAGSPFGTFQVASGGSRLGIQNLLQQKSFQDWMIQESGVTTGAAPQFRKALTSDQFLRAFAESSVPQRAADIAINAPKQPSIVRTLTPTPITKKPQGISVGR